MCLIHRVDLEIPAFQYLLLHHGPSDLSADALILLFRLSD